MEFKLYSSGGDEKYYRGSDGRLYSETQMEVLSGKKEVAKAEPKKEELVEVVAEVVEEKPKKKRRWGKRKKGAD